MQILNPFSGEVEEIQSLALDGQRDVGVVVVGDTLLFVEPSNHYRVYQVDNQAQSVMDYYRALGHRVTVLNGQVSVEKVAGSWQVRALPEQDCGLST
jgi:hypothetical protein